jgi:hypothetical protein
MYVRRGDIASDGQAQGIDQQMPFLPLDTLVRIVATDPSGLLDGLHTLTVNNGRARVSSPAEALTLSPMQGHIKQMLPAGEAKAAEMVEHRLPGRAVAGK